MNFKTHWKQFAAAVAAAATLAAPLAAEAHWLSSAQEKEIGTQAANDFMRENQCEYNWVLDHIQKRLMMFNQDKLWMYGTPGKKRGLEPILMAKTNKANAVSYGGGQIFVYEGMFDHLATKEAGAFIYDKSYQNPWKKSNIYQMSAMAAVVGHEIGHWENEDMLDQYDADMALRFVAGAIPIGNAWTLLGVTVGTNLIDAFNSRQMSFDAEKHADEKSMEYALYVPEYSVGGEAIVEYYDYRYKIKNGIEDKVTNWLHPHSKTAKRLERALKYQEELSNGYIQWDGLQAVVGGVKQRQGVFGTPEKREFDATSRDFFVFGQLATAIHFDICKQRYLHVDREDIIFSDGSPNNVVLYLEGHGNDFKDHYKIIDTYYNVSLKDAQFFVEAPWEKVEPEYDKIIARDSELTNIGFVRNIIKNYDDNRSRFVHKRTED